MRVSKLCHAGVSSGRQFAHRTLGVVSDQLSIPSSIVRPDYSQIPNMESTWVTPLSGVELDKMREACRVSRAALEYIVDVIDRQVTIDQSSGVAIREGAPFTTDTLDKLLHKYVIEELACYPSPLGYRDFPKSVCTSVNSVYCHGIPDDNPLYNGDMMNIDVSVFKDGYHGDNSAMATIGQASESTLQLIDATKKSMHSAIDICAPGVPFTHIGDTITAYLEENNPEYSVVPDFTGHGIGKTFHMRPWILPTPNDYERGTMQQGQIFTIEPVVTDGAIEHWTASDNWTIYAKQKDALGAQWEHTLLITKDGHEILTKT